MDTIVVGSARNRVIAISELIRGNFLILSAFNKFLKIIQKHIGQRQNILPKRNRV